MPSNITEMREEVRGLIREVEQLQRELPRTRSLLIDITTMMSLAGIKSGSDIRRQIMLLYQLKAAYDAVQLARLAAGDPFAWFGAAVSITTTAVNMADMVGCYG